MSIHDTAIPREDETPDAWSERVLTHHMQCLQCEWGFTGNFPDAMTMQRTHHTMTRTHESTLAVECLCAWVSDAHPRNEGHLLTEEVRRHMASHSAARRA